MSHIPLGCELVLVPLLNGQKLRETLIFGHESVRGLPASKKTGFVPYLCLTIPKPLPIHRPASDAKTKYLRLLREPVAQLVERLTFNEDVHGSNPCGLTITSATNVLTCCSSVSRVNRGTVMHHSHARFCISP